MTQLSAARLRELALALDLELADRELEQLRPMVEDLLNVAARIRTQAREWDADVQTQ